MSLKQGSQASTSHSIQTAFARAKALQTGPNRNENDDDQERNNRDNPSREDSDEAQPVSTPTNPRIGTRSTVSLPDANESAGIKSAAQGKKFLDEMRYLVPQGDPATLDGLAAALFTAIRAARHHRNIRVYGTRHTVTAPSPSGFRSAH